MLNIAVCCSSEYVVVDVDCQTITKTSLHTDSHIHFLLHVVRVIRRFRVSYRGGLELSSPAPPQKTWKIWYLTQHVCCKLMPDA